MGCHWISPNWKKIPKKRLKSLSTVFHVLTSMQNNICGCGVHVIMEREPAILFIMERWKWLSLAEARALAGLLAFCVFFDIQNISIYRFKIDDRPCKGSLPHQLSSFEWVDGKNYVFLGKYETVLNSPHLPFPKCSSPLPVKKGADFRVWFMVYAGFWWRALLLHPGFFHPWIMIPSFHLFAYSSIHLVFLLYMYRHLMLLFSKNTV